MTPAAGATAKRARICFVVSSPMTAEAFLTGHVRALAEHFEVDLVANADPKALQHPGLAHATLIYVPIRREISPLADAAALARLIGVLRRGRYAAVHSLTPKAGLLAALAAFVARVPVRMHTYTGQVWAVRRGCSRFVLKTLDRLIAKLDTHVLVDSVSQRDFLRRERVLGPGEGIVLGKGSVSGVDAGRFRPDESARAAVRAELKIPHEALVFLFVGRLARDKGILDLARAFADAATSKDGNDVYLVVVGPDEEGLGAEIHASCGAAEERLRFTGHATDPERYMAASDVFCLPSYREGFGSVVIEAAAAGLPSIGSRIYGVVDAIEDGSTGLLVPPGDVRELAAAMQRMAGDEALRHRLARAARARALSDFSTDALSGALVELYRRTL